MDHCGVLLMAAWSLDGIKQVWAVVAQEIENQLTNFKLVGFNGVMFGSVASITSICTGEAPLMKLTCQKFSLL